jgi:transposase
MRRYTQEHRHYCGINLHARSMYICVLSQSGEPVRHKNMITAPEPFLKAIAPYRDDIVVAVECIFTWYWLADLCAKEGIPFVLGHALYTKAIHGGKAKNDKIDSKKIAALLRGGMIPQAYVYPAKMRATRDLCRRRCHFVRKRAEMIGHIRNTISQYNLPVTELKLERLESFDEVLDLFSDPTVRQTIHADLMLIRHFSKEVALLDKHILTNAKNHDPDAFHILRTFYGIGPILALVILYEIHDIQRFPRVQDFASYSRLVKCAKESAGKKMGYSGKKIGNAHLKWAFSETAVFFLRRNPAGQKYKKRLVSKYGKAKALSILAHKIGRTVYYMLQRRTAFNMEKFLSA